MQPIHVAAAIAFVACLTDLRARRIPNVLTFGTAALGVIAHGITGGAGGVLGSAAGWLVGIALFFPFFALRGLGAGDVKLLGAIGAWLGPVAVFWVAIYASIAGGILALIVAVHAGYLRETFRNIGHLVAFWRAHGLKPVDGFDLSRTTAPKLAYAIPVFTGVLVALWLK